MLQPLLFSQGIKYSIDWIYCYLTYPNLLEEFTFFLTCF